MILHKNIQQTIKACIKDACRNEIAGYLLESPDGKQLFYLLQNFSPDGLGFYIPQHEEEKARRFEIGRSLKRLAFIHSHLSTTTHMSESDKATFADSDIPWIIVCLTNGNLVYEWHENTLSK